MEEVLKALYEKRITPEKAMELLGHAHVQIDDCADMDIFREKRTGIPEVVLCEGKELEHIVRIVNETVPLIHRLILSRLPVEREEELRAQTKKDEWTWEYSPGGKALVIKDAEWEEPTKKKPLVAVITAGTSDIPVAKEAEVMLQQMGCDVFSAYDVGAAGLQRLEPVIKKLNSMDAAAAIVAAGREGTLPVLVSSLISIPVIGLPVSVGYGRGGGGEAALTTMLQSCSPLLVVNIDAGIIAGACAGQIANNTVKTTNTDQ